MMSTEKIEEQLIQLDVLQSACTRCGLCLEGCITYQASGWEQESPRGRIQLAHQFLHGKITFDSPLLNTFDRCLNCQACESLCPQQVNYNQILKIVQTVRHQFHPALSNEKKIKKPSWLMRIKSFQWRRGKFFLQSDQPVLAICCQQNLFEHPLIEKSLQFFKKLAVPVQISRFQPCCGKIFSIQSQSKQVARFSRWKTKKTYFLSGGCQQMSGTSGLYQWIEDLLQTRHYQLKLAQPQTMYYQPHCSTSKSEKEAIQRLLSQIQGLTVQSIAYPQACCGGNKEENSSLAPLFVQMQLMDLPNQITIIVTSHECLKQWTQPIENYTVTVIYLIELLGICLSLN